jgi:hypothetical protein
VAETAPFKTWEAQMEILKEIFWTSPTYLYERAVRVHLEELPPEVREDLEDLFGGDLPDPVDLVAGHYQVEPGDEDLYLAVRRPGGWIEWDAERVEMAGKVWRWVMGVNEGKGA